MIRIGHPFIEKKEATTYLKADIEFDNKIFPLWYSVTPYIHDTSVASDGLSTGAIIGICVGGVDVGHEIRSRYCRRGTCVKQIIVQFEQNGAAYLCQTEPGIEAGNHQVASGPSYRI